MNTGIFTLIKFYFFSILFYVFNIRETKYNIILTLLLPLLFPQPLPPISELEKLNIFISIYLLFSYFLEKFCLYVYM